MTEESREGNELQAAIDRVNKAKINPDTFPAEAPLQFRHAAVALLDAIARLRYRMDGGNLTELDELNLEDETFVIDLRDLHEFVATFQAEGNQRNYAGLRSGVRLGHRDTGGEMSLRDDIQATIRLELNQTHFGYDAAQAALAGERAWGTQQQVTDMLVAYCTALENAVLRIADEVDAISA